MNCRSPWRYRAVTQYRLLANPGLLSAPSAAAYPLCRRTPSLSIQSRYTHDDSKKSSENELLNPPATTRPPPLHIPNREAFESQWKYLFELGKGYLNFYKNGIKYVWTNRRLVREKLERTPKDDRPSVLNPSYVPRTFSRADWVLLWRSRHDMLRLPAFGLMLIVIGEMTVLVVALVEGLVPYPCRIPSQIFHAQQRAETRRRLLFDQLEARYKGGVFDPQLTPRAARSHVVRSLYLSGDMWEYINVLPPGMWKVKGTLRMAFLEGDDKNLVEDGGPMGLNNEELRIACAERGIDILGKSETELRGWLGDWLRLTAAEDATERRRRMTVLLLTRPEKWPENRDFAVPEWTL
ncbi:hypothetical protein ACRE_077440 [Hapsidospora chrysogenum ATCC 11550]|uniref:Letm1 RBD domain-containing protein n=1 Tax=Hapsidospora chrysogenum (strain ATCC 11550 / CBS 779.69 / DSM 880 / IAM 14645 / JCM 23072 / IMI 49137) TaxID=857340 RepID=A0A086SWR0_HAPC1|nr:hypothetical protein ACRE_077440 [Hapsidospora chrysogenum ATCC 11550]